MRGIDRAYPHAYLVIVGSDHTAFPNGTRFVAFLSRIRRMDAATSENLDRFIQARGAIGAFLLAPAFAPSGLDNSRAPDIDTHLGIGVRSLHVRETWEIGQGDIEAVVVFEDDDPVIPDGG